jgi:signal transduction histidine kinase
LCKKSAPLRYSVKNNISEEMKDKIFKPYFTTKNSGSGLGLAMVRQIIEGMEGKVYFDNLLSGGVKFTIELKKIN